MSVDPIITEPQMTDEGKETLEGYVKKAEEKTDIEMLKKLEGCNGNHFWTTEEKECLIYFLRRSNQDFEKLQEEYFPYRTVGALRTRYTKIIRGEDTPASTPRLSVGNMSNMVGTAVNEIAKAVTPRKPIKAVVELQENTEEQNEETQPEIPLPEVSEPEVASPEAADSADAPVEDGNTWLFLFGPLIVLYLAVLLIFILPDDTLPNSLLAFKANFSSNTKYLWDSIQETAKSVYKKVF